MMAQVMPTVLVFSGLDPSGGAGMAADLLAIAAQGVHALPVITALTVQDHNRVHGIEAVAPELLQRQARALIDATQIDAVKIGIPGSRANAWAIAQLIVQLRRRTPQLPVVLDPVLASGHGDALAKGDARAALQPLLPLATLVVPNMGEAEALDL
ncbi:MAG TPA: bifunctional hydroxymethylpyrimidine kinase/phosphomethylpyrimidine kinase, partial [Telluria sp.]